jgi:hypothetical protein
MAWTLQLSEVPLSGEKRAALQRAGLVAELRLDTDADAPAALRSAWLPAARALCLNDAELYFLEEEEAKFAAQISPRNEAAALALLLERLRGARGACVRDALFHRRRHVLRGALVLRCPRLLALFPARRRRRARSAGRRGCTLRRAAVRS